MEYYSAMKKNEIMPFAATWMDIEIIILKIKSNREQQMYEIGYVWHLKKWYKWTYVQNRNRLTDRENKYGFPRGRETEE